MDECPPRHHFGPREAVRPGSEFLGLPELQAVRAASLLSPELDASADLLIAKVVLSPGETIPLHSHPGRGEAVFLVHGAIMAQRGRGKAEVRARGAAYFPADVAHGIEALADVESEFLMCYARADISRDVRSELVDPEQDQSGWPNPNVIKGSSLEYRWALSEDFEPWVPVEPTKGWALRMKYLFDPVRGAPDLVVGVGYTEPHHHYTLHRHEPAELYHILDGRGMLRVGERTYEIGRGSTVYVPAMEVHGIDTHDSFLNDFWVYGVDECGSGWTWEAVEPIVDMPSPG